MLRRVSQTTFQLIVSTYELKAQLEQLGFDLKSLAMRVETLNDNRRNPWQPTRPEFDLSELKSQVSSREWGY